MLLVDTKSVSAHLLTAATLSFISILPAPLALRLITALRRSTVPAIEAMRAALPEEWNLMRDAGRV